MRSLKFYGLCLLLAINSMLTTGTIQAATYYVDKANSNASDYNPGTEAHPWATLSKAAATAQAGDTVLVKAGVYYETLRPLNSGTESALITFKADSGCECQGDYAGTKSNCQVIFDGNRSIKYGVDLSASGGRKYIRIEGLEIRNFLNHGVFFQVKGTTGVEGIEIVNNYIHDNGDDGINAKEAADCLFENNEIYNNGWRVPATGEGTAIEIGGIAAVGTHNVIIRGNNIHHNEKDGVRGECINCLIEDNVMYDQYHTEKHQDGLDIYNFRNAIIRNNLIYDFTQNIYFPLKDEAARYAENVEIYGNILYSNEIYSIGGKVGAKGIFIDARRDDSIVNNIDIHSNTIGWVDGIGIGIWANIPDNVTDIDIRNNILYDSSTSFSSINMNEVDSDYNLFYGVSKPSSEGPHSFVANPQFVNYVRFVSHDFRLQPTSPAIDNGCQDLASIFNLPSPFTDIAGNTRPYDIAGVGRDGSGAYDIGAYEYGSEEPSPSNQAPTANAGQDQSFTDSDGNGSAIVTLNGSGSSDSDGTITSYIWTKEASEIATGVNPAVTLSVGQHNITLTVTDDGGLTDTDTVVITIEAQQTDQTPPSIVSVTSSRNSVKIVFNETLDQATAENINNYNINNGVSIISAGLDNETVTLTTSEHTEGSYTLTVSNVEDTAGNSISESSTGYEYNLGLVNNWKLDEQSGTMASDSTENQANGTLINGATWTAEGIRNNAVSFDGVDDAVALPTANWNVNQGTISLWAKPNNLIGVQYIFGHTVGSWSNRIQLYTENGSLGIGLGNTHYVRTNIQTLDTDTWYHIVLTWDGTNYAVYIDATAKATGSYTGLTSLGSTADIGNTGNSAYRTETFNGIIDEVRVYSEALNADEVADIYENQCWLFEPIGNRTINEGEALIIDVNLREPNNPDIVLTVEPLPAGANFTDATFTWIPTPQQIGTYDINFIAQNLQFQDVETITITVAEGFSTSAVYRFWSRQKSAHFYTINEAEKNYIIATYPREVWQYEGIAYYAYTQDEAPAGTKPVYRFWSSTNQAHFYTIKENEKETVISKYSNVWAYEGIAWYAYQNDGQQPQDTLPVYRFWSPTLKKHFWTINEAEKNYVTANYPAVWKYEGIAWYAYPPN